MDLRTVIDSAYRAGKKEAADEIEVFAASTETLSLYVDDSRTKSVERKVDTGLAVRVAIGKRLGQSSFTCNSLRDAEECARAAARVAGLSPPDSKYERFAIGGRASFSPDVWDERVAGMAGPDLSELSRQIVDSCVERGDVKVPRGMIRTARVETCVRSSSGVEVDHRNTMVYLHFTSMSLGSKPGEGVERFYSPHLRGLEASDLGRALREGALSSSRTVPFKGRRKGETLLKSSSLAEMILSSVAMALDSENVHRRRSAWIGKEGENVASDPITILDDPSDGRGMLSAAYDDEGAPATKRTLVERGVLRSFLYDSYNARLDSLLTSGNGMRRLPDESLGTYLLPVSVSPMNLTIAPGRKSLDELISSIDDGVVIERFAYPKVNEITGAFGLEVRCAHIVKRGEAVETVGKALLVGNMFEALKDVKEVGSDSTVVKNCIVPSVVFGSMELVGSD